MRKNIIVILFITALLAACSDSFLERNPLDQISTDDYWSSSQDLELYVNQYYPSLQGMFTSKAWGGFLGGDDNSDYIIQESPNLRLDGLLTIPASDGGWEWSNIRSVNYFLNHYSNVDDSWDNIKQYVGEAYFFKAYYYFSLMKRFGDVPWLIEPLNTNSEELYMDRTPRNVVTDSIISILDKAMLYMGSKDDQNPPPSYRLNSEIALLFKSRVCLYEGAWEKYHAGTPYGVEGSDGAKFLNYAADASKQLIDLELYDIYNENNKDHDYAALFAQTDYDNNPEILFWREYDYDLGMSHAIPGILAGGHGLTQMLVNSYLCSDGLPTSLSPLYQGDDDGSKVVINRDKRLIQTIWKPGDIKSIVGADTVWYKRPDIHLSGEQNLNPTGYQLKKGFYLEPTPEGALVVSETGDIIFRYAEVLLNYAEAKAELGTITQQDIDISINKLRDRVGLPHLTLNNIPVDPNWPYPDLSPIINEVRRERGVELAAEGFRLDDFLRWRSHSLIVNKRPKGAKFIQSLFPDMVPGEHVFIDSEGYIDPHQKSAPLGYQFNPDRDYLLPIPSTELLLNENMTQNPGW